MPTLWEIERLERGMAVHESGHAVVAAYLGAKFHPVAIELSRRASCVHVATLDLDGITWLERAWRSVHEATLGLGPPPSEDGFQERLLDLSERARRDILIRLAGPIAEEQLAPGVAELTAHGDINSACDLVAAITPNVGERRERFVDARAGATKLVNETQGLIETVAAFCKGKEFVTTEELATAIGIPVRTTN